MKKGILNTCILGFTILTVVLFINCKTNFEDTKEKELVQIDTFENLQTGDIIFQTSNSNQSKAIQLATHSKYSHVGILYKKNMCRCIKEYNQVGVNLVVFLTFKRVKELL